MTPAQIETFFATLQAINPLPASELEYTSVFELLAAVLLSAQATDVGVNKATRRLFPVVNMAVNLTHSDNPQWAERKALSFAATPLHCGFYVPHPLLARVEDADRTYVPTRHFHHSAKNVGGHGIGLGTAMTVSGAAASPNAGYHSQAGTAFLMTLFNLRLGMWVPNPAKPARRYGPWPGWAPAMCANPWPHCGAPSLLPNGRR